MLEVSAWQPVTPASTAPAAGRGYASSGASMAVPVGMTSPALRHQGGESPSSGRQGAEQHLPGIDGEEAHDVKPRRGLLAKLFGRRKGRTTAAAPDGGSHVGDRDRRPQSEMGNATQPVHTRCRRLHAAAVIMPLSSGALSPPKMPMIGAMQGCRVRGAQAVWSHQHGNGRH